MAFAPDGRLFVAQQGGALRVIKNGSLLATPFLTVTVNSSGERGLLGVAFDPDFPINQYVYVYYTATTPAIHNRVSRFTANGDVVVPGSEVVILDLPNLSATNHNGGAIHFGPDGKLYVAVGENAVPSNSQTLANPLGKLLRINRDGSIPTDNPFYGSTSGINRSIWALGLRNPFTFAFQSSTGRLFINDVGAGYVGGDQRRNRGLELRLARLRRSNEHAGAARARVRLWPWQWPGWRVRDRRRRLLQPRRRPVPGVLCRELLLRRPVRRLDLSDRAGQRLCDQHLRHGDRFAGRPAGRT